MKIAIISDIHGNYCALVAVLKDITEQGENEIYCLGDLATIGPQPEKVIRKLREMKIKCIMGNHDHAILNPDKAHECHIPPPLIPSLHWCRARLDEQDIDFIRNGKDCINAKLNDHDQILFYHGSPSSTIDNISAETSRETLDKHFYLQNENMLIGGHTHYQLLRHYDTKTIINPGSVGAPFKHEITAKSEPSINPWAEYALIDSGAGGINIQFRRINYDIQSYLSILRKSDLPVKNWWINQLSLPGNKRSDFRDHVS